MASTRSYPSIQSFYKREGPKHSGKGPSVPSGSAGQGDGFTEGELAGALDPLNRKWEPARDYKESSIGDLVPGPGTVTFTGRVVNASTTWGRSQKQPKAAGWHYLILKGETAAISVWYLLLVTTC